MVCGGAGDAVKVVVVVLLVQLVLVVVVVVGGPLTRVCAFSMLTHAPHTQTCLLWCACVPVFL